MARPVSIRAELHALVLGAALPLAGLVGFLLYDHLRRESQDQLRAAQTLAELAAARADVSLSALRAALAAVSRRPLVRAMDPLRCDPDLGELKEINPAIGNILVVDRDGRVLCSANPLPPGSPVRISSLEVHRAALADGRSRVSAPYVSPLGKRWVVVLVQPVAGAGDEPAGAANASINLSAWRPFPEAENYPPDTVFGIASGQGILLARSHDAAAWIGRDVSEVEFLRAAGGRKSGALRARGQGGVDRIWGYAEVPGTDWIAFSGISAESFIGPFGRYAAGVAAMAAVLVAAALWVSLVLAGRLARPIGAIARAARDVGEGRQASAPVEGPREIAEVAAEFNRMVHARERAALAREAATGRLELILRAMPTACMVLDADSRITFANAAADRLFAFGPGGLAGRTPFETYVPPERHERVRAILARARAGETVEVSGESVTRDGRRVVLEWVNVPLPGGEGADPGLLVMASDVTERRRAEGALRESEERFRALFDASPDVVLIVDESSTIRFANPAVRELLGHDARALVGAPLSLLQPERLVAAHQRGLARYLQTGRRTLEWRSVETTARRSDGAEIPAEIAFTEFRLAGARYFAAFLRDISARKRAEERIEQLNRDLEARVRERTAQLEAAAEELEAFSYSVSHDLRAPVRHINGFLKLLEKSLPEVPEEGARHLRTIEGAAARMGALIDDLLAFSRTSRAPLEARPVALGPLVQALVEELAPDQAGRRVEWRLGALPTVRCDPALMRVALGNLLANALKYTRPRDPAVIEVGAEDLAGGGTAVFVRDNGVGFDMRYADKLFGVFQRLHRDDAFEGTGIGLATVRRVVNRHGGRVWAESAPGEGATFRFTVTAGDGT